MAWVQYINPKGHDAGGDVCDGKLGISLSKCDHMFTVCLDDVNRYIMIEISSD